MKILIVEDEETNQELLKFMLKKLGLENMNIVSTGKAAIDICKIENFDLILMDVHLPGEFNGFEATREILKIKYIPIILQTARVIFATKTKIRAELFEYGAIDYLFKPFTLEDLKNVLINANILK